MADLLSLSQTAEASLALLVVLGMFVMFVRESYPTEVVALTGVAVLLVLGLLPYDEAVAVLSNTAPWTIGTMFIVMGALVRTGALESLIGFIIARSRNHPFLGYIGLMLFVLAASAIVSNTPVVVVMIPIFVQLARSIGQTASKVLIPLSYAAIMGGTITLIGTSTNLLVDGVARSAGMEPFSIFEITPLGLALSGVGMLYLMFVAPKLLPARESMADLMTDRSRMRFFTEAVIPPDSNLIGREVLSVQLFKRPGVRLIDVVRGDNSLRRDLKSVTLEVGDRVVLRTQMTELLSLQRTKSLRRVDQVSAVETTTVEVLITPDCKMVGRRLGNMRLRRRYGVYLLAVHRRNQNIGRQLDELVVRVGDTLLLEGAPADIKRLATDMDMVDVAHPSGRAFRRTHAPIAIAAILSIVVLGALGVAPIFALSVIACVVVLTTGCIDAEEAFSYVEGRLLTLIFAMLAVGAALQHTGAVQMLVGWSAPALGTLPPFFLILSLYLITAVLTELVTNNAIAVIMTPIAIGLAQAVGVDPRPLVVTVMVAASACFATPIGYQTNTLVYGPGGYKFGDFLRAGIPLSVTLALVASILIPILWPL